MNLSFRYVSSSFVLNDLDSTLICSEGETTRLFRTCFVDVVNKVADIFHAVIDTYDAQALLKIASLVRTLSHRVKSF